MYNKHNFVRIAKRENNRKRSYLVVNPLQGKHIPVKPHEAIAMFKSLADLLREEYRNERLLLIGFAETATAIGAVTAIELNARYIQTTREIIPDVEYLFFSEEHSHATEQKLVKDDMDTVITDIDRIIFIEDEITTGNTIWNIIRILKNLYPETVTYSVASILNGMDETALEFYHKKEIPLHYLVKTNHEDYAEIAETFAGNGAYIPCDIEMKTALTDDISIPSWMDARRLVKANLYEKACENLWHEINIRTNLRKFHNILVIGTEEFMYPALFVGNELEKQGANVKCHSTTRSPIMVSQEAEYPLHVRYELRSMYDKERIIFLYDIAEYDCVLILSDAQNPHSEGIHSLVNAIKSKNNSNIILVRWCSF